MPQSAATAHWTGRLAELALSADSAAAMRQPRFRIPGAGDDGGQVGLSWRLHEWSGQPVFGHDGNTVGQSAYLRIDPEHRVAACLLTNATNGDPLYERLFAEVFGEYAGLWMPASPEPAAIAGGGRGGRRARRRTRPGPARRPVRAHLQAIRRRRLRRSPAGGHHHHG